MGNALGVFWIVMICICGVLGVIFIESVFVTALLFIAEHTFASIPLLQFCTKVFACIFGVGFFLSDIYLIMLFFRKG